MEKLSTISFFNIIIYFFETLPFLLCLYFFKSIKSKELRVYFVYASIITFFCILTLISSLLLKSIFLKISLLRIFIFFEFVFLSLTYYQTLQFEPKKEIFIISNILFLIFSIYDFKVSSPKEFSFLPLVIECLFFLSVFFMYFYEKMKYSLSEPIYVSPIFWITVAFMISFSGNFFLFLFSRTNIKDPSFVANYNLVNGSFILIKNIILSISIWVNYQNWKSSKTRTSIFSPNINLDSCTPYINPNSNPLQRT